MVAPLRPFPTQPIVETFNYGVGTSLASTFPWVTWCAPTFEIFAHGAVTTHPTALGFYRRFSLADDVEATVRIPRLPQVSPSRVTVALRQPTQIGQDSGYDFSVVATGDGLFTAEILRSTSPTPLRSSPGRSGFDLLGAKKGSTTLALFLGDSRTGTWTPAPVVLAFDTAASAFYGPWQIGLVVTLAAGDRVDLTDLGGGPLWEEYGSYRLLRTYVNGVLQSPP